MKLDNDDVSNIIAIVSALLALYKSHVSDRRAKQADAKAETALTICTYPECGHTCPPAQAPARPRIKPNSDNNSRD